MTLLVLPIALFSTLNLVSTDEPVAAPPAGSNDVGAPVSAGATEVGGQGAFATTADPAESEDATNLDLSTGGLFSTGNAKSISLTGAGTFRLRRGIHQFRAEVAVNYGKARTTTSETIQPVDANGDPDGDPITTESEAFEETVRNLQGMARYDVFFHPRFSAFLQGVARTDPFQLLEFRLNVDPGIGMYALQKPNHRLWFEVGYDFQYDNYTETDRPTEPGEDNFFINHAARIFGGYSNSINEHVSFDTGLEYLQSFLDGKIFRLNWGNALNVSLVERLSLAATFTLRYENRPADETVEKLDTLTSFLLTFRLI